MAARNVRATHNKHLRDPDVAMEYLADAIESGDKSTTRMAIRNIATAQRHGRGGA